MVIVVSTIKIKDLEDMIVGVTFGPPGFGDRRKLLPNLRPHLWIVLR